MYGINNEMLRKVYETGFALDDAALYLDTHPTDQVAMNYYNYIRNANQEAINNYQMNYGPLMYNQVTADSWNWLDDPWPWEGGNN